MIVIQTMTLFHVLHVFQAGKLAILHHFSLQEDSRSSFPQSEGSFQPLLGSFQLHPAVSTFWLVCVGQDQQSMPVSDHEITRISYEHLRFTLGKPRAGKSSKSIFPRKTELNLPK